MKYKFLLFIPFLYAFSGCNIINPPEHIPTYVKIDSFHFVIKDPRTQGSASNDITSVWVYYNNSPVGIFDMPCNVPVITQGDEGTISVTPGITLDGLSALQPQYPFYAFDTTVLVTNPGKVQTFIPTGKYIAAAVFPYKEDFEVGNSFVPFIEGAGTETAIRRTADKDYVFEGSGSGKIELNSTVTSSESISNTGVPITQGESYLEINYKCSVPFQVGMYNTLTTGVDAYQYFAGVKASDTWKKMYIELGNYTGNYKGKDYKVLIKADLPDGQSDGYVAIDNIKIVSF